MTTLNHQSEFITALKLGRNSVLLSCELPCAASVANILSASNSAAQSEVDSSDAFKKTLSNLTKSSYTPHSENDDIHLLWHLLVPPLHQVVPVAERSQEEPSRLGSAQDSELLLHLLAVLVQ